jgi:predicted glutamine amidotransferase
MEDACQFADCHPSERSIVIASERLNENDSDWIRVAPNHVLTVGRDREVNVELMGIERYGPTVELPAV